MRVKLVSFADGSFINRAQVFKSQAEAIDVFADVFIHNRTTLPIEFQRQHGSFLENTPRGFGFWIWKPVIILQALQTLDDGDFLVYLDAGFTLNPAGRPRLIEYLEIVGDSQTKMLSFSNVFQESHWTKADLAGRLGLSSCSRHMKTSQLGSGFIVFAKTQSNIDLVKEWCRISVEDGYRYSDNSASQAPNHPLFKEHRHDQSIASLLRKIRGTEITHYEVQQYESSFEQLKENVPMWATRLRN